MKQMHYLLLKQQNLRGFFPRRGGVAKESLTAGILPLPFLLLASSTWSLIAVGLKAAAVQSVMEVDGAARFCAPIQGAERLLLIWISGGLAC